MVHEVNNVALTESHESMASAIYDYVKNWQDLVLANLFFLQGHVQQTFYQSGPLAPESVCLLPELIQLHHCGIFTTESQPNVRHKQRSFLSFACPEGLAQTLLGHLLLHPQVYVSVQRGHDQSWHNFPSSRFGLARWNGCAEMEYAHWKEPRRGEEPERIGLARRFAPTNVVHLLRNAVHFEVVMRSPEYEENTEVTTLLLDLVSK